MQAPDPSGRLSTVMFIWIIQGKGLNRQPAAFSDGGEMIVPKPLNNNGTLSLIVFPKPDRVELTKVCFCKPIPANT